MHHSALKSLIGKCGISDQMVAMFDEWLRTQDMQNLKPSAFATQCNLDSWTSQKVFLAAKKDGLIRPRYMIICPHCHLNYGETDDEQVIWKPFACDEGHRFPPVDFMEMWYVATTKLQPAASAGENHSEVHLAQSSS